MARLVLIAHVEMVERPTQSVDGAQQWTEGAEATLVLELDGGDRASPSGDQRLCQPECDKDGQDDNRDDGDGWIGPGAGCDTDGSGHPERRRSGEAADTEAL